MLANIAIGLLEASSIALGVEASDAMCKMASVKLVKAQVIAKGKYTILISGPVGEVVDAIRRRRTKHTESEKPAHGHDAN